MSIGKSSELGFTVLEAMVAFSMLTLVSMGFLSLYEFSAKSSSALAARNDVSAIQIEVLQSLSNTALCTAALSGMTIEHNGVLSASPVLGGPSTSPSALTRFAISPFRVFSSGEKVSGTRLKVASMRLHSFTAVLGATDRFAGFFSLKLVEAREGASHTIPEINAPLTVQVNSTRAVESCVSPLAVLVNSTRAVEGSAPPLAGPPLVGPPHNLRAFAGQTFPESIVRAHRASRYAGQVETAMQLPIEATHLELAYMCHIAAGEGQWTWAKTYVEFFDSSGERIQKISTCVVRLRPGGSSGGGESGVGGPSVHPSNDPNAPNDPADPEIQVVPIPRRAASMHVVAAQSASGSGTHTFIRATPMN
jgi:hypothetical protein